MFIPISPLLDTTFKIDPLVILLILITVKYEIQNSFSYAVEVHSEMWPQIERRQEVGEMEKEERS
jgi:hypothetical protein